MSTTLTNAVSAPRSILFPVWTTKRLMSRPLLAVGYQSGTDMLDRVPSRARRNAAAPGAISNVFALCHAELLPDRKRLFRPAAHETERDLCRVDIRVALARTRMPAAVNRIELDERRACRLPAQHIDARVDIAVAIIDRRPLRCDGVSRACGESRGGARR